MADDGRATLAFDLPDRDLALVLSELHWHLPEKLYPEAWRAFTTEQERRAAKGRPLPIPIPSRPPSTRLCHSACRSGCALISEPW